MRCTLLAIGLVTLGMSAALAADEASAPAASAVSKPKVVYLPGSASLEALRSANPGHYARAQRIIAASDELCRPGPLDVYFARFEAKDISCHGMFLKTSYPPKRQISFQLDDTRYVALVVVTDKAPRWVPAR